jgi:hypothetical protein
MLLQESQLRSMHLCFLTQPMACTTPANRRQTAMVPTTMLLVQPNLNTQRAQAPIGWGGWSSQMVMLLHTTMFVRQNPDLATQRAQAAIGREGCNSPMDIVTMQVLMTDTLCFLFFSLAGFFCHITSLFAKSSHSMYGLPLVLEHLASLSSEGSKGSVRVSAAYICWCVFHCMSVAYRKRLSACRRVWRWTGRLWQ